MDYRKIKETMMKATKRVLAYRLFTRMLISLSREPAVLADESRELTVLANLGQLRINSGQGITSSEKPTN
jgi:hypothetical protein